MSLSVRFESFSPLVVVSKWASGVFVCLKPGQRAGMDTNEAKRLAYFSFLVV